MQIRTFALISALALGLPACTSTFSDVRLTSNDSHVAVDAVNHQEARAIQAAVIAAARDMHPVNGDATFLLLTGSTYGSYEAVGAKLGAGYVLPDQAASDVPFYGVRSLRTQKDQGDVTVVVPNADKFGLVDAHLESKKTADGHNWEVVRLTDRSTELHSLADVVAEENKAIAPAAVPAVAAPEAKEPAAVKAEEMQPEHYNWFERNILGKQTQEQKAAAAAEKEAKAQARAAKEAEEKAAAEEKAKAKAEVAAAEAEAKAAQKAAAAEAKATKESEEKAAAEAKAAEKAAAEAKPAEEAKQPEHYNWFERNILGKQTQEQKAAAAAEKEAKAQAKAAKEAEEKAAAEAKAAEEAAAAAKAAEEKPAEAKPAATGKKRSTWFESKVLGKDNAPEAEPAK